MTQSVKALLGVHEKVWTLWTWIVTLLLLLCAMLVSLSFLAGKPGLLFLLSKLPSKLLNKTI